MTVVCRLCAELKSIADIKTTINDIGWNIRAKLVYCCQWNTSHIDDALPQEVCNFCFNKLEECWAFSQSVSAAQVKLEKIYESKPNTEVLDVKEIDLIETFVDEPPSPDVAPIQKKFTCSDCNKCFLSRFKLNKHKLKCPKISNNDNNSKERSKTKRKTKKYECTECYENFSTKEDYDGHMKEHHSQQPNTIYHEASFQNYPSDLEVNVKIEVFEEDNFTQKPENVRSIDRQKKKEPKNVVRKLYFCYLCNKQYSMFWRVKNHMLVHTTKVKVECKYCQRRFHSNTFYFNHLRMKHGVNQEDAEKLVKTYGEIKKEGQYVCEQCGKRFKEPNHLRYHSVSHINDRPFKCEHCGKGFKLIYQLNTHYRVHTGERKYQCTQCGKRFTQRYILEKHMEDHSGVILRPFPCDWGKCGKKFRTQFNLDNHRRTHTGEKPFRCEPCNYSVATTTQLSKHLKTKRHFNKANASMKS